MCVAREFVFHVKREIEKVKLNTLDQVITQGTKEEILSFLREKDWLKDSSSYESMLAPIMGFCTDKDFFLKLLIILRDKSIFHFDIWKYSLLHLDHQSLTEFINSRTLKLKIDKYISYLSCSLIKSSRDIGEWNRIYEYYPLINSRVHLLKRDTANILNKQFRNTY